jgi:L-seryl-tRNA(Ser) seleniumtransferase
LSKTEQLRNLPSVDEVLRREELADLREQHPHRQLAQWARDAVDYFRKQILDGVPIDAAAALPMVLDRVRQKQQSDEGQSIQQVINATGIVLHTNLGRAPLAKRATQRMIQAAQYSNVELNLQSGRRSKRGERVSALLAQLAGSEDAVVVNNCAAATMLVLQAIAKDREVIVSRGQLVEIGGGFRLPDVFQAAGVVLREVGTTNRTYLRDYEAAVSQETGAIIRVHRSNFLLTGFVTEPTIDELVTVDRPADVPVIDDLGSGCIEDLSDLGLHEPTVPASVKSGADLTLFSGDKLFGGPQSGIIVGQGQWINLLRKSPMMRAMRVDKLTLAALEATTEIHLSGDAFAELPTLQMLSAGADEVLSRCQQLRQRITDLCAAEIVECESQVGGGSVPGAVLPSFGLKISGSHADRLASSLRIGTPAVQARVTDDSLLLDLRTVGEDELETLVMRVRDSLAASAQDSSR